MSEETTTIVNITFTVLKYIGFYRFSMDICGLWLFVKHINTTEWYLLINKLF